MMTIRHPRLSWNPSDIDWDSLSDVDEEQRGTEPQVAGGGRSDGYEVRPGTDALLR